MNAEAKIAPGETTDIVQAVFDNPVIVFLDNEKFDVFYEKVKSETDKLVPNTATQKGRDEIRSMAAKVTKTKTTLEAARKSLTEEWRQKTNVVNAAGKEMKERLEALAEKVREPLTAWEQAEKEREDACRAVIDGFKAAKVILDEDTSATVRSRGMTVFETEVDEARFRDLYDEAIEVQNDAVATLRRAMDRLIKEEADREELDRLRAEVAARAARERAENEAREAAEREKEAARVQAEREAAAAQLEQQRIALAAREAEERARVAAAAEAQRQIDEANERARKAEAEAEAERVRIRDEENRKQAEAELAAAEQAAREADQAHRAKIKGEIEVALTGLGVSASKARQIVMAIVAGDVPHTVVKF